MKRMRVLYCSMLLAAVILAGLAFTSIRNGAAAQTGNQEVATTWQFNARANSDYPPDPQRSQHEPHIAISRTDPNVVVAVAKDYRVKDNKEVWIYVSHDGGLTWPVQWQRQIPGMPPDIPNQSDPITFARDDGRMYVVALGHNDGHGIFITWSDDDGVTWQDPSIAITYNETPNGLDDKEWMAIDNNPASPYYHNMYVAWATGGIVYKRSTDGGNTWSSPYMTIAPGNTEYPYPVITPEGTLYVFYMNGWGYCADGYIEYVKSIDGGVSFTGPYTVAATSQPCSPIHGGGFDQFRFFSIITAAADPTDPNNLWVGWTDDNNIDNGKTDVLYVRSTDGGVNWTDPARLSHDDPQAYVDHITPVFSMSQDGRLHAFWLDRRDDPENKLWNGYHTSTRDGITWEADTRVSDQAFDLNLYLPPPPGYNAAGDYWGLDVVGNTVMAAWNTTVETSQDIYVARGVYSTTFVTLTGQVVDDLNLLPLEGASVSLNNSASATTDASGTYTLTVESGVYTATASAAGYFPQVVGDLPLWSGIVVQNFSLKPEVSLSGQVTDADTSSPIADAMVALDTGVFTNTNAGGFYSFTLPPGIYTATASSDGYVSLTISGIELTREQVTQDFALQPEVTLTGKVSDADTSLPIADALVTLNTGVFTSTDAGGIYTFSLPPGIYTGTASADGYIPLTVSGIELVSGKVTQDFALDPVFCPIPEILSVSVEPIDPLTFIFTPVISTTLPVVFDWQFGDGSSSSAPAPIHSYPGPGSYTTSLDVTNTCGSDSWSQVIQIDHRIYLPQVTKVNP